VVQENVAALEAKAHQDATVVEWLCKEQDDLRQTKTRLRSECDEARRERNSAQQRVSTLHGDLEREGPESWRLRTSLPGLPGIWPRVRRS
jgi:FtsZ-binding cell division protein ZapB